MTNKEAKLASAHRDRESAFFYAGQHMRLGKGGTIRVDVTGSHLTSDAREGWRKNPVRLYEMSVRVATALQAFGPGYRASSGRSYVESVDNDTVWAEVEPAEAWTNLDIDKVVDLILSFGTECVGISSIYK